MDRELTPKERAAIRRRRLTPFIAGAVVILGGIMALFILMHPSVRRGNLVFATVDKGTIKTSVTGTGSVVPAFEEIINSPITSRIIEVYCKAGDSVDTDTPLLRLDLQTTETEFNKLADQIQMKQYEYEQQQGNNDTRLRDLEMQIRVKEMTVNRLEADLSNERYLDSIGSGTGDRIRQAELAFETGRLELEQLRQKLDNERRNTVADMKVKGLDISIARKNLDEKRRTLDDARIRAPRRATLTFISDQIGQKISEGERVAVISDLTHFKVDGELPDGHIDKISVGSKALVRIGKDRIPGTVSNITPLSHDGVVEFSVRLDDNDDPRLRPGLRVDIYVMCGVVDDVVRVPNGSFFSGAGTYSMYVTSGDDRLERREVRLGDSNYEYVEVISGLNPGEQVVINDMSAYSGNETLKIK
ncbi:MAG: HlyD family efflux transporter periplasmic adaptor subunit [Duncaniella sp.]|nr:HlyD family efflux transporter periplasmic adaptor subunit [Duncaniella sp.]